MRHPLPPGLQMRALTALLVAIAVVVLAIALALVVPEPDPAVAPTIPRADRRTPTVPITLDGLSERVTADRAAYTRAVFTATVYTALVDAERARIATAARRRPSAPRPGVTTGSCADMAPPGWMAATDIGGLTGPEVIARESGGDPNVYNSEGSGAYGCVQLMPTTGGTGTQAERWARTWAGGAGACHWIPPRYCAG